MSSKTPKTPPAADRRQGQSDRRGGATEDEFLDALRTTNENLEATRQAVTGAKRRSWVALAGAVVAVALALGLWSAFDTLKTDRRAGRASVCRSLNAGIDRDRKQAQSLIDNSAPSRPLTAEEQIDRLRRTRAYASDQGFAYDAAKGKIIAAYVDCQAFAEDPRTRTTIKGTTPP